MPEVVGAAPVVRAPLEQAHRLGELPHREHQTARCNRGNRGECGTGGRGHARFVFGPVYGPGVVAQSAAARHGRPAWALPGPRGQPRAPRFEYPVHGCSGGIGNAAVARMWADHNPKPWKSIRQEISGLGRLQRSHGVSPTPPRPARQRFEHVPGGDPQGPRRHARRCLPWRLPVPCTSRPPQRSTSVPSFLSIDAADMASPGGTSR